MRASPLAPLLLVLALPAAARRRAPKRLPEARAVLLEALSPPARAVATHGRVQTFAPGRRPKGLDVDVVRLPDGSFRRELRRRPRQPAQLIVVDDGRERRIWWPKEKALWAGVPERETPRERLARLEALYRVSLSTGGHVAKRPTWRVDLRAPDGRLRRSLWVGRADGLLLKTETYGPDGVLRRRERALKVRDAGASPALLSLDVPAGAAAVPLNEPDPALARVEAAPGLPALWPRWVPEGYLPTGAAASSGAGGPSLTLGYSDGAESFSVTEAGPGRGVGFDEARGRPVRLPGGGRALIFDQPGGLALLRRTRARTYLLIGPLSEDELVRAAESLPEGAR